MINHHIADGFDHIPTRQGIVTDIGNAVRRQILFANGDDRVTHLFGNPRIGPMADDVVEGSERVIDIGNRGLFQLDICQPEAINSFPGFINLLLR